jgi:hypothetical protein
MLGLTPRSGQANPDHDTYYFSLITPKSLISQAFEAILRRR